MVRVSSVAKSFCDAAGAAGEAQSLISVGRTAKSESPAMQMDEFDVVVIGAGAAGVAAARRLSAANRSVRVLESRRRLGGRAWTCRREPCSDRDFSKAPDPREHRACAPMFSAVLQRLLPSTIRTATRRSLPLADQVVSSALQELCRRTQV